MIRIHPTRAKKKREKEKEKRRDRRGNPFEKFGGKKGKERKGKKNHEARDDRAMENVEEEVTRTAGWSGGV